VILVDTSVVLDVLSDDPQWCSWSKSRLIEGSEGSGLAINDVVYAELSIGYDDRSDLETTLAEWHLAFWPITRPALFGAGKAFQRYRRQRGAKTGVLPDFFIGAHAAAEGWPLLTRDATRIRTYFPTVRVIAP